MVLDSPSSCSSIRVAFRQLLAVKQRADASGVGWSTINATTGTRRALRVMGVAGTLNVE